MDISADELSWNKQVYITDEAVTDSSTVKLSVDNAPDSEYVLMLKNSTSKPYSGSVKAGDFWMEGQGDLTFEVTQSQTLSQPIGPFESGRFMQSDSTFELEFADTTTQSNLSVTLLEVPK